MSGPFETLKTRLFSNTDYNYPMPIRELDACLRGTALGRYQAYSEKEIEDLRIDVTNLAIDILLENPERSSQIHVVVGAPASGKSLLMRSIKTQFENEGRTLIYLDPLEVCIWKLETSFAVEYETAMQEASDTYIESSRAVYQRWRPAAQGAFHLLASHFIREKYSLLICSKSSDPNFKEYFEFYHAQNYQINLIHLTTSEDVRRALLLSAGIEYTRAEEAGVEEITNQVFNNLAESYLKHADHIDFYLKDHLNRKPVLAYQVSLSPKANTGSFELLRLIVVDREALNKIALIHDAAVNAEAHPEKGFRATISKRCERVLPTYE